MASFSPASVGVGLGSSLVIDALEAEPDAAPSSESSLAEFELDFGPEVEVDVASTPVSHGVVGVKSYTFRTLLGELREGAAPTTISQQSSPSQKCPSSQQVCRVEL